MLIDGSHKRWAIASVAALAASTAVYVPYSRDSLNGPSGKSWTGLTFGILGTSMIVFCALLAVRKRVPSWRLGRTATWLRAHLWLGLLSVPMIAFHSGFAMGGLLSTMLNWIFMGVILSGVFGLVMQQILPRLMTQQVEVETIYEQIPHVISQLRTDSVELIESVCGPLRPEAGPDAAEAPAASDAAGKPRPKPKPAAVTAVQEGSEPLREFYLKQVEPFMALSRLGDEELSVAARSKAMFAHVRKLLPAALQGTVAQLEDICDERRQLETQVKLHHWLHGWLFVHGPLTAALLLLTAVHAVVSFKY